MADQFITNGGSTHVFTVIRKVLFTLVQIQKYLDGQKLERIEN